jgi:hypothetical protein
MMLKNTPNFMSINCDEIKNLLLALTSINWLHQIFFFTPSLQEYKLLAINEKYSKAARV